MPASVLGLPTRIEVGEQFANADQQRHAAQLGMWAWLLTELLLFGGSFTAALVLYYTNPEGVRAAVHHLKFWFGATNTLILICSSLTMSGAIVLSRLGGQRWMVRCMLATAALGSLFLVLKGFEYWYDYSEHMMPFLGLPYELANIPSSKLFVNLYFVTTGLHGLHLVTGVSILLWLAWEAHKPNFLEKHQNRIEIYGLYWHFIDLIWIVVFPIFYVVGR